MHSAGSSSDSICKLFIFQKDQHGCCRNLLPVKSIQVTIDHFHIPEVDHMVLRPGCRSRVSCHLHGQSGKDQRIHQLLTCIFLSCCNFFQIILNSPDRFCFQVYHRCTIVFIHKNTCYLPVCQRNVFSQNIRHPGCCKPCRRLSKNIRIRKNKKWRRCLKYFFYTIPGHVCYCGSKSV